MTLFISSLFGNAYDFPTWPIILLPPPGVGSGNAKVPLSDEEFHEAVQKMSEKALAALGSDVQHVTQLLPGPRKGCSIIAP